MQDNIEEQLKQLKQEEEIILQLIKMEEQNLSKAINQKKPSDGNHPAPKSTWMILM